MKMRNPFRFPQHWAKTAGCVQITWDRVSYHAELERELHVSIGKWSWTLVFRNDNKYGDNRKTLLRSVKRHFDDAPEREVVRKY